MPFEHVSKLLHIRIPKTAGSSVGQALGLRPIEGNKILREDILYGMDGSGQSLQHLTLQQIYNKFPDKADSYFKFTFIRHPVNRLLAGYRFRASMFEDIKKMSIDEYVDYAGENVENYFYRTQKSFLIINRRLRIDWIGRFESLEKDFKELCKRLHRPYIDLPKMNPTNGDDYTSCELKSSTLNKIYNFY